MKTIHVLFLLTLCFLGACSRNTIKIGTVTIRQDTNSITMIHGNRTNVFEWSEEDYHYAYIVTTPYVHYFGSDGWPELPLCRGLRDIPLDRPIRKSDFPLFQLFDGKPTCLGVMRGGAGVSGGSWQTLYFMDTASSRYLEFYNQDLLNPVWITGKDHPVGYKTFIAHWVGNHCRSLGVKPRLDMTYSLVNDAFVPDVALKMAEAEQCYSNIVFTAQETMELGRSDWSIMDRDVAEKLLDAVHYGIILDKRDEVNNLLAGVAPDLCKEIKNYIIPLIPTNTSGAADQADDRLGLYEFRGLVALGADPRDLVGPNDVGACNENALPPAISSYWQVSGLTDDGWIEYINKPLTDLKTVLSGSFQGSIITNEVITRGQYLSLKRKGFKAGITHYEIIIECVLDSQLKAFMALRNARPARVSHVRNIDMKKLSLDELPCTLACSWDQALRINDQGLFDRAAASFRRHLEVFRDDVYGGLLEGFADVSRHIGKTRKWLWLQQEAQNGLIRVIEHTGAPWAADWYGRIHAYVHDRFSLKPRGLPLWIFLADRKVTFERHSDRIEHFHLPRYLMLNLLAIDRLLGRRRPAGPDAIDVSKPDPVQPRDPGDPYGGATTCRES